MNIYNSKRGRRIYILLTLLLFFLLLSNVPGLENGNANYFSMVSQHAKTHTDEFVMMTDSNNDGYVLSETDRVLERLSRNTASFNFLGMILSDMAALLIVLFVFGFLWESNMATVSQQSIIQYIQDKDGQKA